MTGEKIIFFRSSQMTFPPQCLYEFLKPGHGTSGQSLHIVGIYEFNFMIKKKEFHLIRSFHEDVILWINFIYWHIDLVCFPDKEVSFGATKHTGLPNRPKIQVSTTLNAFVKANLLTKGGCLHCPNTKCLVHIITRDQPYIIWRIAHPMGSRWPKRNLLGAWRKSRSVIPIKLVCSASMQLPTGKSDREQLSNQSSRNLRKKMLSLTDQDHIDSGT